MIFIHEETGAFPVTTAGIRSANPTTSFPDTIPADMAEALGYAEVLPGDPPEYDAEAEKLQYGYPAKQDDGKWYLTYEVVPLSESEVAAVSARMREQRKAERQAAVAAITVTTDSGLTFDGDEESQTRMARAVVAMSKVPGSTMNWVLADNSVAEVTEEDLTEALILAGTAQTELWVIEP